MENGGNMGTEAGQGVGKGERMDRRKRRTRRAIRDAYLTLLEERDYSKITVTELARVADIDRKTFYLHYDSLEALVDELIEEEALSVAHSMGKVSLDERGMLDIRSLYIALSAELTSGFSRHAAILSHVNKEDFIDRLQLSMSRIVVEEDALGLGEQLGPTLELFSTFVCSGLLSTYRRWLETNSELPLDELAALVGASVAGAIGGATRARAERQGQTPVPPVPPACHAGITEQ